jgi:hypothetical protein
MPAKKPASARKGKQPRDEQQLRASSRDLLGAEQGREPTSEEREPPVYEQGLNDGPNIAESIDVELIDDNLYRSKVGVGGAGGKCGSGADASLALASRSGCRLALAVSLAGRSLGRPCRRRMRRCATMSSYT